MADFLLEAEDLANTTGYRLENNAVASGGSLLSLVGNGGQEVGTATFSFSGEAGVYDILVGAFDEADGQAVFELDRAGSQLGRIVLNEELGGNGISAATQVERAIASGVEIADGDEFTLTGFERRSEHARFDFIRFVQVGSIPENLTLDIDADSISENGGTATATVTRTGDLSTALTVTLESSDTSEATVPTTVEIPAGQASAQFQVTAADDSELDGTQSASIAISADGFVGTSSSIDVTDDDTPQGTTIQIEAESIADTDRFRLRNRSIASGGQYLDLLGGPGGTNEVGTATFAFDGPSGVYSIILGTFDENDGEAQFELAQNGSNIGGIVLDQNPGGSGLDATTQVERLLATEIQVNSGDSFTLTGIEDAGEHARFDFIRFVQTDEAAPTLGLNIDADSISEGGGIATATLTRTGDLSAGLTVTLDSSDTSAATVPTTVEFLAGQDSIQFQVTAVDDDDVDDTQTSIISATATGFTGASDSIDVTNDDVVPTTLSLDIDSDSISENGGAATATLTRSGDLSAGLTVTLDSSDTTAAAVPTTVEFLAGQDSVQFQVTGVDDDAVDGTQSSTISATADGVTVSDSIDVTDDDTPQAPTIQIEAESISDTDRFRLRNRTIASGGQYLDLLGGPSGTNEVGTATFTFDGPSGVYSIILGTFDENDGEARFELDQNGANIGGIDLDQNPGGSGLDATTQVERLLATEIQVNSGDSFTLTGIEDGGEHARFDFIRFVQTGDAPPALSLALDADSISENGGLATATLTRTGDLSAGLTVTLDSSDTTAATVPTTVEFLAGQDSIQFQVTAVDDDDIDDTQTSVISASAAGFTGASDSIDVTNDDVAPTTLGLAIDTDSISENGGTATATLTRTGGDLSAPLTVTLDSSDTTAATVPATVEFLAGQDSIQFQVSGVDDDVVDGTQSSTISATAPGLAEVSDTIEVLDDDEAPSGDVVLVEVEDIADTTRFRRIANNNTNNLASGGALLSLQGGVENEIGTATFTFDGNAGVYNIIIGAFDENDGESRLSLTQNGSNLGSILLDENPGGAGLSANTRVERLIAPSVSIAAGDTFTLTAFEDEQEQTRIDFIRFEEVGDIAETAPTFLSPVSFDVTENQTFVADLSAQDLNGDSEANGGLTYSLSGGADSSQFSIDSSTGELRFLVAPDFENPADSNGNNIFSVGVTVTDSTNRSTEQLLNIRVNNETTAESAAELPVFLADNGTLVLESESTPLNGDWFSTTLNGRELYVYDGPNFLNTAVPEQQLEYRFRTDQSGEHFIAVYAARFNSLIEDFDNDSGNDVFVAIENAETGEVVQTPVDLNTFFGSSDQTLRFGSTFSFDGDLVPASVDLQAGTEYRLLLFGRSAGFAFDRITIRNGSAFRNANAPESAVEAPESSFDAIVLEAEDAALSGAFRVENNDIASGDQLVGFSGGANNEQGSATFTFNEAPGTFDLFLGLFDEADGISNVVVSLNDVETGTTTELANFQLDGNLGSNAATEQTAILRSVGEDIALTAGDSIVVSSTENNDEPALLDFLQFVPTDV